jgi:hypothetical protein
MNIQVGKIPEPLVTLLSRYGFRLNVNTCSCPECTGLDNLIVERSAIRRWVSEVGLETAHQALQQIDPLLETVATTDQIGLAFQEIALPLSPKASMYWLRKWKRKLRKVIANLEEEQAILAGDQRKRNLLAYAETGESTWDVPAPTFLVDGKDLVRHLLGNLMQLQSRWRIAGIGVASANTDLLPTLPVFDQMPEGSECRRVVLHFHNHDAWLPFVSVDVRRSSRIITWSRFERCATNLPRLLPAGPFHFSLEQYAQVLALAYVRSLQQAQTGGG